MFHPLKLYPACFIVVAMLVAIGVQRGEEYQATLVRNAMHRSTVHGDRNDATSRDRSISANTTDPIPQSRTRYYQNPTLYYYGPPRDRGISSDERYRGLHYYNGGETHYGRSRRPTNFYQDVDETLRFYIHTSPRYYNRDDYPFSRSLYWSPSGRYIYTYRRPYYSDYYGYRYYPRYDNYFVYRRYPYDDYYWRQRQSIYVPYRPFSYEYVAPQDKFGQAPSLDWNQGYGYEGDRYGGYYYRDNTQYDRYRYESPTPEIEPVFPNNRGIADDNTEWRP